MDRILGSEPKGWRFDSSRRRHIYEKNNVANFLFEVETLTRLQRTGWQVLGGDNKESIAEHSFMVTVISFILATKLSVDLEKVLLMALFHDAAEARTGDVYKLADKYVKVDVSSATKDAFVEIPETRRIILLIKEYEEEKTMEAKIVHDADTLALCLELKQLMENGNIAAREWFEANINSLKLKKSVELARSIKSTNSQGWWKKEREELHKQMGK